MPATPTNPKIQKNVKVFLDNKIKFLDIAGLIRKMIDGHKLIKNPTLNNILDIDRKTKEETKRIIEEEIIVGN